MVTDEAARSAATEILSANEYTRWYNDYEAWLAVLERIAELVPDWLIEVGSWIERTLSTVFEWIGDFIQLFGVLGDVSDGVGWLSACVLLAALIVLGWKWQERRTQRNGAPSAALAQTRSHADALRDARQLAQAGRYLEAAHRVQLATLAMLIEFKWLELARSDPNRTLRDRVRESALPEREREELIGLVDRLESLWFNEPRDDPRLFDDWVSLDERILQVATGGVA